MTDEEQHFQNRKQIDHVVSVIVSIILLMVFNTLPVWNIPFLTGSYIKCLWAIDLSIGSTIIVNFVFLFYEKEWFRHFMQIFLDIFALIAAIVLYYVFPFSFSSKVWENTASIALIIIMVITGISIVYEISKTILSIKFKKPAA
jgi:hypothetical protein